MVIELLSPSCKTFASRVAKGQLISECKVIFGNSSTRQFDGRTTSLTQGAESADPSFLGEAYYCSCMVYHQNIDRPAHAECVHARTPSDPKTFL